MDEDFSEGIVLGGVAEPLPVFTLEEDLLEGSTALREDSFELPEVEDLSVLKLLLDNRRRSCKKEGMPRRRERRRSGF